MAKRFSVQDRAQIATKYEIWQAVVAVQRWWRGKRGKHETFHPDTIKNCHRKLMTTGSVCDAERSGRSPTSRSPVIVDFVQEMFTRSPETSIRKASLESGFDTLHNSLCSNKIIALSCMETSLSATDLSRGL